MLAGSFLSKYLMYCDSSGTQFSCTDDISFVVVILHDKDNLPENFFGNSNR